MMRCVHCKRDYLGAERFCHQCGEALQWLETPVQPPADQASAPVLARRAWPGSRRRVPQLSSSLMFAILVCLCATVWPALYAARLRPAEAFREQQ